MNARRGWRRVQHRNDSMIHPSQERRSAPSMHSKAQAAPLPGPSFSMAALTYLAMAIAVMALGIFAASLS